MATGRVVPHPPAGPRPDYLPRYRAGTRYVRPDSLPPLERGSGGVSGITRITKPTSGPSGEKSSKGPRQSIPARHTAKSRARAAFLEEERAKFDEKFPPLRRDPPIYAVAENPLVKRPEPNVEPPCDDQIEKHCAASANQLSTINQSKPITSSNSAVTHVSSTGMFSGVYAHEAVEEERKRYAERDEFAKLVARKQEEYARIIAEREEYTEANAEIMELIKEYETFLSHHPAQLAEIRRRISVNVKDAEQVRRQGDYKREFAIRKAHLQDLFYNKAQVVTLLKKQEEERKKIEESVQAEIDKIEQNDEMLIERKVKLLKEMLYEAFPSDDDEYYEDSSDEEEDECNCDREDCDCSESDYDEECTENNEEEEEPIEGDDDEGKCDVHNYDEDMDYDGDDSDCEDDEDNMTMKGSIYTSLAMCSQTVSDRPVTACGQSGKSTSMKNENPICDEVCHLCKQQTSVCSLPPRCCTPTDSETLEDLASEVEEGILENLAKLGRLLNLEMVHNEKNDTEMLDRVESLLTMMEMVHQNKEGTEKCCEGTECKGTHEDNKPTELAEETSMPDLHVDDPEEDDGPILPAFTSTSINTSYPESKPSVNTLRSNSSTENRPMKSEGNMSSSVVVTAEETNLKNVENSSVGRSGKKQVSFVQNQNAKPHKSCSTFYARMSINEMAELVSSVLVSEISLMHKDSGRENENMENGANQPSAIGVKYVSIMTTEKNENSLKPVFARNHENKQNTVSFSITGEILLSSFTNEVNRESSEKDCNSVAWDGNTNVNQGMSLTTAVEVVSVQSEHMKPTETSQVSTEQTVSEDTGSQQDSRLMENSAASTKHVIELETSKDSKGDSTSDMGIASQSTSTSVECSIETEHASENNERTPAHFNPQFQVTSNQPNGQNCMAFEVVDSTSLGVDAIVSPTCEMVPLVVAKDGENSEGNTGKALVLYNPQIMNLLRTETAPGSKTCQIVNSSGKETSGPTMDSHTSTVASSFSASEQRMLIVHPRILKPHTSERMTLAPANTDSEPNETVGIDDNSGSQTNNLHEMTATCSASGEEDAEKALVPFNSQIVTLKILNNNAMPPVTTVSENSKVVDSEGAQIIQMDKQTTSLSVTETNGKENTETATLNSPLEEPLTANIDKKPPESNERELGSDSSQIKGHSSTALPASVEENIEHALVPFDSQIVTLKAFPNVAELTAPDSATTSQLTNTVESDDTKPNLESKNDPPCTVTAVSSNENSADSHIIEPEIEVSGHRTDTTEIVAENSKTNGHDLVNSFPLNSSMPITHKSLPSFRTADLEEAVNGSGKCCEQKRLHWTRSMEPRTVLLPRRPKNVDAFRSHGSEGKARSRVMEQRFCQFIPQRETRSEAFEKSNSGVKCSKSFRSQPALITTDVTLPYSPHPSKTANNLELSKSGIGHLDGGQVSQGSVKSDKTDSSSLPTPNEAPTRAASKSGKLRKLHSLPPIFRKDGHRFTYEELKRSQSYNTSSDNAPKLPIL